LGTIAIHAGHCRSTAWLKLKNHFTTKNQLRKNSLLPPHSERLAAMTRYFFDLKDGGRGYYDDVGVELPSHTAAADYARLVAAELVKNREKKVRHWHIDVRNDEGRPIVGVALVTCDQTLAHLPSSLRAAVEDMAEKRCALEEAVTEATGTRRRARALIALSRGRPRLVSRHGELV
jgi:hypothetical protein